MPSAYTHTGNLTPEEARLLRVMAEENFEAMKALDYPAPYSFGIQYFWFDIEHRGYSTQPSKASTGQELRNTIMAFLSDKDDKLSFNPKYIQVRYNEMIVKIKCQNLVELTDLEFHFMDACDERRGAEPYGNAGPWEARLKYIEYWHNSDEDFPALTIFEIMVFARKLFRMYLSMLEVQGRISNAMDTGEITDDHQELIMLRLSIKGLENLLGAYVGLCKEYNEAGPNVLLEAASIAEDPLSKYKEQFAPEAEDSNDEVDEDEGDASDTEDDTPGTSEAGSEENEDAKMTRLLLEGFEQLDLDKVATMTRTEDIPLQNVVDEVAAAVGSGSVSEKFAEAMAMLDALDITDKVEVLKKNADKVVDGQG